MFYHELVTDPSDYTKVCIHPVKDMNANSELTSEEHERIGTCYQVCSEEEATMWSLYGLLKNSENEVECLGDYDSKTEALKDMERVIAKYGWVKNEQCLCPLLK